MFSRFDTIPECDRHTHKTHDDGIYHASIVSRGKNVRCNLGDPEVIDNITIRYSTYNFLFDFNGNHVYFVPFLSYSELFVESDQF